MIKHVCLLVCVALFAGMASCNQSDNKEDEFMVIDLQEIIKGKREYITVDQLAKNSRVIPLETTDVSLFRFGSLILYGEDHIYVQGPDHFLLFDKEGNFIRTIAKKGEGPEEYIDLQTVFLQNGVLSMYDINRKKILQFSNSGQLTGIIPVPERPETLYPVDDMYVGFIPNPTGDKADHFICFDRQGEMLDRIPYPDQAPHPFTVVLYDEGLFFESHNSVNFKEIFNDTVYTVQNFSFIPRYAFELGERKANPNARRELVSPAASVFGNMLLYSLKGESESFVFISVNLEGNNYLLVFDKKEKQTRILTWEGQNNEDIQTDICIMQGEKESFLILQTDDLDTEDNPVLTVYTLK